MSETVCHAHPRLVEKLINFVAHNVMLFLSYFSLNRYLQHTLVSESKKCFLVEYSAIEYTILIGGKVLNGPIE